MADQAPAAPAGPSVGEKVKAFFHRMCGEPDYTALSIGVASPEQTFAPDEAAFFSFEIKEAPKAGGTSDHIIQVWSSL